MNHANPTRRIMYAIYVASCGLATIRQRQIMNDDSLWPIAEPCIDPDLGGQGSHVLRQPFFAPPSLRGF
jgi:hypothetical protein